MFEFDCDTAPKVTATNYTLPAVITILKEEEIEVESHWQIFSSQEAFETQQPRDWFYRVSDEQLDFIASQTTALSTKDQMKWGVKIMKDKYNSPLKCEQNSHVEFIMIKNLTDLHVWIF